MKLINYKFFLGIIFLLISTSFQVLSQAKHCEIKYGEQISEEELEKKSFGVMASDDIKEKYMFDCYQIGVEHNEHKEPISNKPIYACCQNI